MVNLNGEWYYQEYAQGAGVSSVGMQDAGTGQPSSPPAAGNGIEVLPPTEERKRILDLFKN